MPAHALAATFSRDYLKDTYGGSTIKTFPEIAQKHFNRHGLRDFMFLNLDFNPFAPQIPGSPGLFFECETNITRRRVQRVFTRLAVNEWQPEGLYDVIPCLSLTKVEWQAQKPAVSYHLFSEIYICLTIIEGEEYMAHQYIQAHLWAQCSSPNHSSKAAWSGSQSN